MSCRAKAGVIRKRVAIQEVRIDRNAYLMVDPLVESERLRSGMYGSIAGKR